MWNKLLKGIKGIKGEVDLTILFFGLFIAIVITAILPTMAAVTNNINLQDAIRVMNAQGYWCTATEQVYPYNFYPAGDNTLENGKTGAAWSNVESYNYNGSPITRTADYVFAANDSSAAAKDQADYVCDGTDDNVEIQTQLDVFETEGLNRSVLFLPGTYWMGGEAINNIKKPTNVSMLGYGAIFKMEPNLNELCRTIIQLQPGDHYRTVIVGFEIDGNIENNNGFDATIVYPYSQGLFLGNKNDTGITTLGLTSNCTVRDVFIHDTIRTALVVTGYNHVVDGFRVMNSWQDHLVYITGSEHCNVSNGILEGYVPHDAVVFGTTAGYTEANNCSFENIQYYNFAIHPLYYTTGNATYLENDIIEMRGSCGSNNRLSDIQIIADNASVLLLQSDTLAENIDLQLGISDSAGFVLSRDNISLINCSLTVNQTGTTTPNTSMIYLDNQGAYSRSTKNAIIDGFRGIISDNDSGFSGIVSITNGGSSMDNVVVSNSVFLNENSPAIAFTGSGLGSVVFSGNYFNGTANSNDMLTNIQPMQCETHATSFELDLDGGEQSSVVFSGLDDGYTTYLSRIIFVYTEAPSADAGVIVELGMQTGEAFGNSPDWYLTTTSATSSTHNQWDTSIWGSVDLGHTHIGADDRVVAHTTGNKTGAGNVMVYIEVLKLNG